MKPRMILYKMEVNLNPTCKIARHLCALNSEICGNSACAHCTFSHWARKGSVSDYKKRLGYEVRRSASGHRLDNAMAECSRMSACYVITRAASRREIEFIFRTIVIEWAQTSCEILYAMSCPTSLLSTAKKWTPHQKRRKKTSPLRLILL